MKLTKNLVAIPCPGRVTFTWFLVLKLKKCNIWRACCVLKMGPKNFILQILYVSQQYKCIYTKKSGNLIFSKINGRMSL